LSLRRAADSEQEQAIIRKEELHKLRTEGWRNVADAVIFRLVARRDEKETGTRRQNPRRRAKEKHI
jgi:hypothetical protein